MRPQKAKLELKIEHTERRNSLRILEVNTMSFLFSLLLIVSQSSCCRQNFSYPVMANITRIEIITTENGRVKEINDRAAIESIIRFIDERRSRWCSPSSGIPPVSANLNLYKSEGSRGTIGIGKQFFVAQLPDGKYMLKISSDEQQSFFKLLQVDENAVFK